MAERGEIETAATLAAMRILRTTKAPTKGLRALVEAEIFLGTGAPLSASPEAKLAALLQMATSDPLAFHAVNDLAAAQIAVGEPIAPPLRQFVVDVLSEKIKRPKRQGNRPRDDVLLRVMQYVLIRTVARHFGLAIGGGERDERSAAGEHVPNACEIVAEAFSRAGKHTTKGQMKSLVYDENAEYIRKLGDWAMS